MMGELTNMPNLNISIHYDSKLWCRQGDHWLKIRDAEYDRLGRAFCPKHRRLVRVVTRNFRKKNYLGEAKWVVPKKIPESWERSNLK